MMSDSPMKVIEEERKDSKWARKRGFEYLANKMEIRANHIEKMMAEKDSTIGRLTRELDEARRTVRFFAVAIKSGEEWSSDCKKAYDTALSKEKP